MCVASKVDDIDHAVLAEQLGYSHLWFADSQMLWSDCYATMALAAVRATREAEVRAPGTFGRERLPCIVGVPLPGERVGAKAFDGRTEAAVFPGDLPDDPASLLDGPGAEAVRRSPRPSN